LGVAIENARLNLPTLKPLSRQVRPEEKGASGSHRFGKSDDVRKFTSPPDFRNVKTIKIFGVKSERNDFEEVFVGVGRIDDL
jgi:hypothetical protein